MKTARTWMMFALVATAAGCRQPPAATTAKETATVVPTATAPAATPVPAAGPVLGSGAGEVAGVRVEVHELKRASGGTVMMKFSIVNDSDGTFSVGYTLGSGSTEDFGSVGGAFLADPVGKKKYLVVRDSDAKCLCSRGVTDIARGRATLWAKFPAPPAGTDRISVVIPHFMPMDDVSISM